MVFHGDSIGRLCFRLNMHFSRSDPNLWPFELKVQSVHLCRQLHRSLNLVQIPAKYRRTCIRANHRRNNCRLGTGETGPTMYWSPNFLAVVFKKQAISQQVVTRMQDLASEFSKIFREWYPRTLTAGGGDPLPHPTPRCWEPNLSPPQLFSGGCAPDDYNDDNKSSKLLVSLKVLNSRDD